MSRTFWFVAGATSTAYAYVKVRRTAAKFTPDGAAAKAASLRMGARLFAAEVSAGMAEKEAQLREELAVPAIQPGAAAAALESRPPAPRHHDREGTPHGHR